MHYRLSNTLLPDLDHPHTTPKGLVKGYSELANGTLQLAESTPDTFQLSAGGVIATAEDLVKWNEILHNGKLLSDSTYRRMVTASARRAHRWGELGYGYGVQVGYRQGVPEISHNGNTPGFISTLIYYPESRTSIVVLENVAWDASDLGRVFYFHDHIRNLVPLLPGPKATRENSLK